MPLRLTCGCSRKIGEANFGSRGATVAIELELEAGLVNDPQRLQNSIRQMFAMAKQAVEEELGRNGQPTTSSNGNGHHRQRPERPATQSQVRAINAIADRQHADLVGLLQSRFQTEQPDDLSIQQASQLIDELKANGNGAGGRR